VPGEQSRYLWFGKDGEEDVYMVVQVDYLLVNSNENWYKKFVEYLQEKGFEIKDMGLASRFMEAAAKGKNDYSAGESRTLCNGDRGGMQTS
jgi:hypothetical protein